MSEKIAIYGNTSQDASLESLPRLFKFLVERGFQVEVYNRFARYLKEHGVDMGKMEIVEDVSRDVALVVSLGGDGTFLRAARWIGMLELPILGINTGHLGFLASCSLPDSEELISNFFEKRVSLERRMLLEISSASLPADQWHYALNEVAFMRLGSSMLDIDAYADDTLLANYRGDGLIVSTPTGSTAYSLSAGGPVIEPTIDCICLTPVAPHTLTLRPLVIGADSTLRLIPKSRSGQFILSYDDRATLLPVDGEFYIRRAPYVAVVVRKKDESFPSILRQKLLWNN
ncbi:MAG: NAD(+)/NADH kinase [Muribaculaceae bacterium]|nr:NAD(+)/NADH kinase [Muribaculaceae bacterium]